MDFEMPVMNGIRASKTLCDKMKKGLIKTKTPIIALTAYNDEKKACLNAGMKRFCKNYLY